MKPGESLLKSNMIGNNTMPTDKMETEKADNLKGQTMLEALIRAKITEAVKARDNVTRDILRFTLGEMQRFVGNPTDEDNIATIRKIIKGIEITAGLAEKQETIDSLNKEKEILNQFLPKTMSKKDIITFIAEKKIEIDKTSQNGKIMGLLMKALKLDNRIVDANIVKEVVAELKGT